MHHFALQVGFKYTGRRCTASGCNGRLKDQVLDWGDALPEDELTASEKAAADADLAICLGTSLQITPACNIPLKTTKAGKSTDKCTGCTGVPHKWVHTPRQCEQCLLAVIIAC